MHVLSVLRFVEMYYKPPNPPGEFAVGDSIIARAGSFSMPAWRRSVSTRAQSRGSILGANYPGANPTWISLARGISKLALLRVQPNLTFFQSESIFASQVTTLRQSR